VDVVSAPQVLGTALLALLVVAPALGHEDMGAPPAAPVPPSSVLYVAPVASATQRAEFVSRLRRGEKPARPLYEQFLPLIGANGLLEGVQNVWPRCHMEGHDLGKVIYARLKDIRESLKVCRAGCYSGCMHGVVMEALTSDDPSGAGVLDLDAVGTLLKDFCRDDKTMTADYSPGDCVHGVGHALAVGTDYDIGRAIGGCASAIETSLVYYCATGVYMEYVTERDAEDAKRRGWFYPCDSFMYPAACARYKMVHVARRHYQAGRTTEALRRLCDGLRGAVRLGCFHGLGNAHMLPLAGKAVTLDAVCLRLGEMETFVCIEGAIERLAKFNEPRAREVCATLMGRPQAICDAAVANKMYSMTKDLTVYVSP
jgi:hypothetical protein